jgi:hypothetical protein
VNGAQLRMILALSNLAVVTGIGVLAFRIVKGVPFPESETPSETFDPVNYQVPETSGPASSIGEYRVAWLQLDRAKPKPVVAPPPKPVAPPPQVIGLASRYRLVTVFPHPSGDVARNTAIVEERGSRAQTMVKPGGKLSSFVIDRIEASGSDVLLTVRNSAGRKDTIRLVKK